MKFTVLSVTVDIEVPNSYTDDECERVYELIEDLPKSLEKATHNFLGSVEGVPADITVSVGFQN